MIKEKNRFESCLILSKNDRSKSCSKKKKGWDKSTLLCSFAKWWIASNVKYLSSRIRAITSPRLKLDILICPPVFFHFTFLLISLPPLSPIPSSKNHGHDLPWKLYSPIDSLALQFLFIPRRTKLPATVRFILRHLARLTACRVSQLSVSYAQRHSSTDGRDSNRKVRLAEWRGIGDRPSSTNDIEMERLPNKSGQWVIAEYVQRNIPERTPFLSLFSLRFFYLRSFLLFFFFFFPFQTCLSFLGGERRAGTEERNGKEIALRFFLSTFLSRRKSKKEKGKRISLFVSL